MKKNSKSIISALLVLIPPFIFGFMNRPTEMSIALASGFIAAVLINLDRFESFKAGNVEAKIREAEKAIDDATATIEQLNAVTAPLLKANLSFLLYEGVFDGMPVDEKVSTFLELVKIKDNLKISDVDEHFTQAAKGVANHYFFKIFNDVGNTHDGFRVKYNKYTTIDCPLETPSVKELEVFFEKHPYFLKDTVKVNFERFKEIKEKFVNG